MFRGIMIAAAAMMTCAPAAAAVYTVNVSIDFPLVAPDTHQASGSLPTPLTMKAGDTVVFDVTFNQPYAFYRGQELHFSAGLFGPRPNTPSTISGMYEFFGNLGTFAPSFAFGPTTSTPNLFAYQYDTFGPLGVGTNLTGVRATYNYITGADADLTLFVVGAASIPEPATWALMILGFGAAGAALRQRADVRHRTPACA